MGTKKPIRPVNGGSTFQEVGSNTTLEMFSEDRIALNREVMQHPMLQLQLKIEATDGDEGMVIGTIAAYCNVKMDGAYQREEIENLYPILVERLRKLRRIRIH